MVRFNSTKEPRIDLTDEYSAIRTVNSVATDRSPILDRNTEKDADYAGIN